MIPLAGYVHQLRPELPPEVFRPARSRLWFVPLFAAVAGLAITAIALGWVPWFVVPALSLVIGTAFAGLTFVAHEGMHGGIVRGKRAKHWLGLIGFLPFTLSPRLWAAWHDRVHHAKANLDGDPDMYPTLAEYRASRAIRIVVNAFSLGGRRWRGGLSLVLGFTVQSAHQLAAATSSGFLSARQRKFAIGETALGVAVWAVVAAVVGFVPFLFVYVLPLVIANIIVMSFILTNHGLSPRVTVNDPLVSSLSVTVPSWVDWLTLRFGFHVEHHLFPAMSSRHAPAVRALLRVKWPERYQSMPLFSALGKLHATARIYKDATTLVDPQTGIEYPTLLPREASVEAGGPPDGRRRAPRALVLAPATT